MIDTTSPDGSTARFSKLQPSTAASGSVIFFKVGHFIGTSFLLSSGNAEFTVKLWDYTISDFS